MSHLVQVSIRQSRFSLGTSTDNVLNWTVPADTPLKEIYLRFRAVGELGVFEAMLTREGELAMPDEILRQGSHHEFVWSPEYDWKQRLATMNAYLDQQS